MSVNPDDMDMTGAPTEYVDLEHQVIRQKVDGTDVSGAGDVTPGDEGAEFEPGERQLDREEVAQLVYYRRYASINFLETTAGPTNNEAFAIVDASVGINGDLFREVTTQRALTIGTDSFLVDTGGEIGLLDNYQVYASPPMVDKSTGVGGGASGMVSEFAIDYYNWPTGGPIVDSFDTITCGFGYGYDVTDEASEVQIELRYDFYWDVREQGRSTNPFGRPSVR